MYRTHISMLLLTAALSAAVAAGCVAAPGNATGDNILDEKPTINVYADGRTLPAGATIAISGSSIASIPLSVINTGNGPLEILGVQLTSEPPGAFVIEHAALPFSVAPTDDSPSTIREMRLEIRLTQELTPGAPGPTGLLMMTTNYQVDGSNTFSAVVEVGTQPPALVAPSTVDLGTVVSGGVKEQPLTVTNVGGEPLLITELELDGDSAFSLPGGTAFDPALEVAVGASAQFTVRYAPELAAPASGDLRVHSNDPAEPIKLIALQANVGGPCIAVSPLSVDFGGTYVGNAASMDVTITSCGDEPLIIDALTFDAGPSGSFGADVAELQLPISVPVNKSISVPLSYIPESVAALSDDGFPIRDEAVFVIGNNSLIPDFEVDTSGWGASTLCPTPVIKVMEGEEVIPQTTLHLVGSQSYASAGGITHYEWSVTTPEGSVDVFLPASSAPDPSFQVNVAGVYVFTLRVADEAGQWSHTGECAMTASYTVIVVPDDAIHVELLWHTPGDPDESDTGPEAGADLDLHLLHPFALADGGDGWFHPMYDAYWFNGNPNWGSFDPVADDNPSLDRDDTDGGGPENMNLGHPEAGVSYRVGVHYWNDHGWGSSLATVRIYVHSVLVFESMDVEMSHADLWNVADIAWPSGQVTLNQLPNGDPDVSPNYPNPLFP